MFCYVLSIRSLYAIFSFPDLLEIMAMNAMKLLNVDQCSIIFREINKSITKKPKVRSVLVL